MIHTYPLKFMTLEEATTYQFRLIDTITKHFSGTEFLNLGSVGVKKSFHTQKVEQCLADFFHVESALLVRGAGTGALRWGLFALIPQGGTILVHDAPIYPTTETTFQMMNLQVIKCNFNDSNELKNILSSSAIDTIHIQLTRQKLDDSYDIEILLNTIHDVNPNIPISCDDNYGVMKVSKVSTEIGADISSFSLFKLLGPEGIGCILGKEKYVSRIREAQYSGGSQVQGHESMEVLRSLVYTPVMLALQSQVVDELALRLNTNKYPFIKQVIVANAQSKVLLVEFHDPIAPIFLKEVVALGGLPHPVGAESRYDVLPLFYKVSGTFLKENPRLGDYMIRINPNRAGVETIIRLLTETYHIITTNTEK